MKLRRGLFGMAALLCAFVLTDGVCSATSPRYESFGDARMVEVQGPNLLKLRLLKQDQVITVRLLGVGSPRNRDRVRGLNTEILSYIRMNQVWQTSREFVRSLLSDKVVEVWVRRWNQFDEKGRLLAYVLVPSPAERPLDLNGEIIRKGLGFVTRDYVHVTFVHYKSLEEDARRHRRGLWQGLPLGRVSSLNQ